MKYYLFYYKLLRIQGKNDKELLERDRYKIILLDHQNNYVENSSNAAKSFDILTWASYIINLFWQSIKITFRSIKFLDISAKLFFPCIL